jgi:hypothetical protein
MPINLLADTLQNPHHYERMVQYMMALNPACRDREWATDAIDNCIRKALANGDCSTGMCAAYRTREGKVRLFLEPLRDMSSPIQGTLVTKDHQVGWGVFYPRASHTEASNPDLISEDRPNG